MQNRLFFEKPVPNGSLQCLTLTGRLAKNAANGVLIPVSACVAAVGGDSQTNMKKISLYILCLCMFTWSVGAQDKSSPAADNSGRNKRDRSGETQTSGDQPNKSADVKTTAAIRRAIMHDSSLSSMAKNVKIITENGVVTLRGPVKSKSERTKIAELAKTHAGNAKIEDQLEVKASE